MRSKTWNRRHHISQSHRGMPESGLKELVPGKDYAFYVMLHGVVQHGFNMADNSPC